MEEIRSSFIDWGVAVRACIGEDRSGDAYVVKALENKVLAAAIDGLGHGEEAADASRIAVLTLTNHSSEDATSLVKRCHEALARTRGVVLSLASFNTAGNTMTWLGVGNVDGFLMRADHYIKPSYESLFQRGGVVGYQLPSIRPSTLQVNPGDTLIFSTDGIRSGFIHEVKQEDSPQRVADMIITNYNRKTDDALVLVVRYIGGAL
jgi:serine phosphatase RsbU (regulator of sigma subunit)